MSTGKEPFLSRWSRRKLASAKDPAAARSVAPAAPSAVAPGAAQSTVKTELPPVETLKGLASEYRDFLRPGVDEKLRQSALKRLFNDPHFKVMDGLDTYIDDYSKPDPIPQEMLKSLKQANRMIFPEEAAEKDAKVEADTIRAAAAAPENALPAEAPSLQLSDDESRASGPESPPARDSKPPVKPA